MRRFDPFDRRSWAGSLAVHAVALSVAIYAVAPAHPKAQFITYQIELVSPPPARQAPEAKAAKDKLVVERPKPAPAKEDEAAPVVKPESKKRTSKVTPPKPKPTESTETAKKKETAASPDAETSKSKKGGEGINVRLEGLKRDYPAYYANIIRQIERCFRPPHNAAKLVTTVYFIIHHDGTVSDLSFTKRSGDPSFDFLAMGAVECAGKGRFGPLPEDVPYDRLPVQFTFTPSGSGGGGSTQGPDEHTQPKEDR